MSTSFTIPHLQYLFLFRRIYRPVMPSISFPLLITFLVPLLLPFLCHLSRLLLSRRSYRHVTPSISFPLLLFLFLLHLLSLPLRPLILMFLRLISSSLLLLLLFLLLPLPLVLRQNSYVL